MFAYVCLEYGALLGCRSHPINGNPVLKRRPLPRQTPQTNNPDDTQRARSPGIAPRILYRTNLLEVQSVTDGTNDEVVAGEYDPVAAVYGVYSVCSIRLVVSLPLALLRFTIV